MFDTELFDREGNVHRFSDFKGKVVVVDMWYTGCMPCKVLGKELKAMHSELAHMDDVVFLSLSVDRQKDLWLRSLEEGEYTHDQAVNLWIGELAMKHPIAEYYSILGYPQLMIVDKEGNLAVRNAIRPYRISPDHWNGFIGMVEKYR
nr:TlpA disulfide reductase family protein [Sphingobacterium faecale]